MILPIRLSKSSIAVSDGVFTLKLGFIVGQLGGYLHGSPEIQIYRLFSLAEAVEGDISFLSNPKYSSQLENSQASCIVVGESHRAAAISRGACIVTENPYAYWAKLTQLWVAQLPFKHFPHIHPTAVVDPTAVIHPSARIGPLCVVEGGVRIGEGSWLKSRVTVSSFCEIGNHCTLHSGVVVGADGFGFALEDQRWIKIEQLGKVVIGNHVEIGANSCIDRGALGDTVLEDGVILDNLIQIGHNVRIGKNTAMAGCSAIAGSSTIGAYCTIGGGAGVLGHIHLTDHV
ncbi:MAG: UDP-3-O-(3-hydroxymyristoyl)glucosamine N-acyltransferase, partial [Limnohabitans sp.]